ncbi:MAG: exodeoxyribonuclease VII small subunit [Bacteroidia bacterium]|nr:exodeoxyribonuclease VII small subunit [Bacteroidia bacterium]
MEKKKTYDEAYSQLEILTEEIKNGEIPLDLLTKKIKEAKTLIGFCQTSLGKIEDDVNDVLHNC